MELLWKKYSLYWRNPMFLGVFIGLAATMAKLSVSVFIGRLIDYGVIEKNSRNLMSMILAIAFYGIIGSVLWVICKIMFQKASYRTGKQIRLDLYDCMHKMSVKDIEQAGSENIENCMAENIENVELFIGDTIPRICYLFFSVIGSIVVIVRMHIGLGSVYFWTMCLFGIFLYNMLKNEQGKKKEKARTLCGIIAALSFPCFLCLCLMWVDEGAFSIGNAITFFLYLYPIRKIAPFAERLKEREEKCQNALKEINILLHYPLQIKEGKIPFSAHSEINIPQIVFQHVDFIKEEDIILKDFNLEVSSGEYVGIIADEKQGKAISYLLPRFYEITSGKIMLDGLDISQYTFRDLRNQIGMVQKEDRMYIGNFYENLMVGNANIVTDDLERALYAVGLLDTVEKMQRGLRTPIWTKEERVFEQRMFCMARMLLKEPAILILNHIWKDCGKSQNEMEEMIERIKEAYPYMTILCIEEQIEKMAQCDQVINVKG